VISRPLARDKAGTHPGLGRYGDCDPMQSVQSPVLTPGNPSTAVQAVCVGVAWCRPAVMASHAGECKKPLPTFFLTHGRPAEKPRCPLGAPFFFPCRWRRGPPLLTFDRRRYIRAEHISAFPRRHGRTGFQARNDKNGCDIDPDGKCDSFFFFPRLLCWRGLALFPPASQDVDLVRTPGIASPAARLTAGHLPINQLPAMAVSGGSLAPGDCLPLS
jgi:hypothetical protein